MADGMTQNRFGLTPNEVIIQNSKVKMEAYFLLLSEGLSNGVLSDIRDFLIAYHEPTNCFT